VHSEELRVTLVDDKKDVGKIDWDGWACAFEI